MNDSSHSHGHLFSRVARRASASLTRRRRTVYQQKQHSVDAMAASSPAGGAVYSIGQAERERKDSVDSVIIYNGSIAML